MNLQNQQKYLQTLTDTDMFDGLTVPAPLEIEPCVNAIMIRCGLLTPIYSEPQIMRSAVTQWSIRMQWTFTHLIQVIEAQYSPIENTDRYSEHTETREGAATRTHGGTDTATETHGGADTITNEVSAYNAGTYQADRKETQDHGETITNAKQYGETITDETDGSVTYTEHTHGNIGVTSNVTLINEELELLRHFDVYGWIAEKFEEDLCLMIY